MGSRSAPPEVVERGEPAPQLQFQRDTPDRPRRRTHWGWLWLLVLAAAVYFGYRYFEGQRQQQRVAQTAQAARMANRAVPVSALAARVGDIPVYLRGLGTATPFNSVTVRTRVDGQLVAVHFREGQFITKGDPLAEIDPRPFQVQLEQAQGQLARDEAQRKDAQANLERYEFLWKQGVIAKQQRDTQAATVDQFNGAIAADQAAIDNAKLQLVYAHITAPISGRIGLRQVDMGNMVHAADANGLAVIDQLQPITVLFTIPADNLPPVLKKLHAGAKLPVEAWDRADTNKIASGTLLTVDNQIDPTTGTSRLKAVFSNADSSLFPNQFVNCRLLIDTRRGAVILPAAAIQRGPQGTYVYLVKPDKTVEMRQVAIGLSEGNELVVEQGVKAGDLVVVDGQDKLQNGMRVNVHVPARPPAPRSNKP